MNASKQDAREADWTEPSSLFLDGRRINPMDGSYAFEC